MPLDIRLAHIDQESAFYEAVVSALRRASPDGIMLVDQGGQVVFCNQRYLKIWAIPPGVVASRSHASLLQWTATQVADRTSFVSRADQICAHTEAESHDKVVLADGRMLDQYSAPVRLDDGTYLGRVWVLREIHGHRSHNEHTLTSILEAIQAGVMIIDPATHKIVYVNAAAARLFGAAQDAIAGAGCHKFVCPADIGKCPITDLGQTVDNSERILLTAAGTSVPIIKTVSRASFNGRACLIECFVNNSESKRAELALRRTNRALLTLSAGNAALVNVTNEAELLQDMCRVMIEHGGYQMAWIGFRESDAAETVRPAAWAGEAGNYPEIAEIPCADMESGGDEAASAAPLLAPWQLEARKHGFASSVALPLRDPAGVFGVFAILSARPDAFEAEDMQLLRELASDLAYGIRSRREQVAREAAVQS